MTVEKQNEINAIYGPLHRALNTAPIEVLVLLSPITVAAIGDHLDKHHDLSWDRLFENALGEYLERH